MTVDEVREKFIKFFKAGPRNHKEISPAPLVPLEDPSTLFTSSGMQKLVPNFMGDPHPEGKRLVDSQPCIRVQDIEEVGDNRHTTFFEMLGNWSLGDYFKAEQLLWFWEFLTKEIGLDPKKLYISVYRGNENIGVDKDRESVAIWKEIFEKEGIEAKDVNFAEKDGMQDGRIFYYDDNWWSRSGLPEDMPPGEIGGPDSEVYYLFSEVKHDGAFGEHCHPECECGRFLEIGNSVFIQYKKEKDGTFTELPNKNVDFGGGLERMAMAVNNNPDMFQIDIFQKTIMDLEKRFGKTSEYGKSDEIDESYRIIADHLRASVMLINEGVTPSNKLQGYILRRLIRRSVFHFRRYFLEVGGDSKISTAAESLLNYYPELKNNWNNIAKVLDEEFVKFDRSIQKGERKLEKYLGGDKKVNGTIVFDLYQTDGFPLELTLEILEKKGIGFSDKEKRVFESEFEKHKELSRTASAGMFKGGLADKSEEVTKLHTVTHLLHASLRKVLGNHVQQKGSNITAERLRFDFSYKEKLRDDQIKKVEKMMNKTIEKDFPVTYETKTFKEAIDEGALAFFGGKYGEKVKVYTIGPPVGGWFSKEVCGGPHITHTSEIGRVRIKKQEKIGAGLIRVYVVAE